DNESVRQRRGQPGGLAGPARAEKEKAALREGEKSRQYRHNARQNDDTAVILSTHPNSSPPCGSKTGRCYIPGWIYDIE
ncbi:MAG: hypothetical protein OXH46_04295, partial [Gemmatimonadetes bacterium]|nr:hypothetical protein [Gemmatimonadota bacterium]